MERQVNLDAMRFFGVVLIMIAHATPPFWLAQLRNFGTPLLIVASALTYATIYKYRVIQYLPFIKKRLARLIFPAWIFLTFFFVVIYIWFKIADEEYPFSLKNIISTYSFYYGIGYVWIFKVYIILALFTPVALKIKNLSVSNVIYFLWLSICYFGYEFLLESVQSAVPAKIKDFMDRVVFILVPYALLYLYGMRLSSLSNITIIMIATGSFLIFIYMANLNIQEAGQFIATEKFKYPPTLYYLSYAFSAVNIIYLIARHLPSPAGHVKNVILWLSSNSLWIYLWHIMAVFIWKYAVGDDLHGLWPFINKFIFIFSFGCVATYLQLLVVNRYINSSKLKAVLT